MLLTMMMGTTALATGDGIDGVIVGYGIVDGVIVVISLVDDGGNSVVDGVDGDNGIGDSVNGDDRNDSGSIQGREIGTRCQCSFFLAEIHLGVLLLIEAKPNVGVLGYRQE